MRLEHCWLSHLYVLLLKSWGKLLTQLQEYGFPCAKILGPLLVILCFHYNVVPPIYACGLGPEVIICIGGNVL